MFKKNTAVIGFGIGHFINAATGAAVTTGTPTCKRTIDGTGAACANAAAYNSDGAAWEIDLADTDMNGDVIILSFTLTDCLPIAYTIHTVTGVPTANGNYPSDLVYIHGAELTETDGQLAGRFVDFFDQASAAFSVATALASFKATGFSTHDAGAVVTALGTGSTLTSCATATGFATPTNITQASGVSLAADQAVNTTKWAGTAVGSVVLPANLTQINATSIAGTSTYVAAAFKKLFNVETPTGTINSLPDATPGAENGLPILDAGGRAKADVEAWNGTAPLDLVGQKVQVVGRDTNTEV